MRKPRDFDSELRVLADKAKALKEKRVRQLGELVAATGADALDADLLVGALLGAVRHPAHRAVAACGEEMHQAVAHLGAEMGAREAHGVEAEGESLGLDVRARAHRSARRGEGAALPGPHPPRA